MCADTQMWSVLGELPRELWTANVLPLLALNDLVRVDTAIASKIGREEFSALLKDHHVQIDDSKLIQWGTSLADKFPSQDFRNAIPYPIHRVTPNQTTRSTDLEALNISCGALCRNSNYIRSY
jgi:hypothetical protein